MHVIGIGPLNDPAASTEAARLRLGEGKIVLFLGQLHHYKGFRSVLDAAMMLEDHLDVQFVFAGPDVRGNSRSFAKARPNVKYLGPVSNELRDSLLQACTILCVPSTRESFGAVLVEAWACGKPVVAGTAPAVRDLVEEGKDGFTVPQSGRMIAERLTTLLNDAELRKNMGEHGRAKVRDHFSWKAIAAAHMQVYSDVLARRGSGF